MLLTVPSLSTHYTCLKETIASWHKSIYCLWKNDLSVRILARSAAMLDVTLGNLGTLAASGRLQPARGMSWNMQESGNHETKNLRDLESQSTKQIRSIIMIA